MSETKKRKAVHEHIKAPESSHKTTPKRLPLATRVAYGLYTAVWVTAVFIAAQIIVLVGALMIRELNLTLPFALNETVLQTIVSVFVYVVAIALAVAVPWFALKQKLTWKDVGLEQTLPRWRDVALAPLAFIVSMIATAVVMGIAASVLPGVDLETEQQVGFENLTERYEMLLAFFTLVVLAPVCEEVLFRGYFYGRVRRYYNALWTIALTSVVFGLMHVYAGPDLPLQWNVMIGTTVLAIFIGLLREYTGSIWAGILLHMIKNAVAFFFLFVAPLLGITLIQ